MATLGTLAEDWYSNERSIGAVIDPAQINALAIAACRFYIGYASLPYDEDDITDIDTITEDTEVSASDWAVIRPLFILYVEREVALQLEASQVMGVQVFGRTSSEIAGDIATLEAEIPHRAFYAPVFTL